MGEYISSVKVQMFPSAYRGYNNVEKTIPYNPESRLNTEYNLINLVNRLITVDTSKSFVIGFEESTIVFSIHGYYFSVDVADLLDKTDWNDIYATIIVKALNTKNGINNNTGYQALTLVGDSTYTAEDDWILDNDENKFTGITFSNVRTEPLANGYIEEEGITVYNGVFQYDIHLLKRDESGEWIVPHTSILKFKTSDIADDNGGELESITNRFTSKDITSNTLTIKEMVKGNVVFAGNLNIKGNVDIEGTTTVKGKTSLKDELEVTKDTNITTGNLDVKSGTLHVGGNSTLDGTLKVGSTTVDGLLNVAGDGTIGGKLEIQKNLNVVGNIAGNDVDGLPIPTRNWTHETIENHIDNALYKDSDGNIWFVLPEHRNYTKN